MCDPCGHTRLRPQKSPQLIVVLYFWCAEIPNNFIFEFVSSVRWEMEHVYEQARYMQYACPPSLATPFTSSIRMLHERRVQRTHDAWKFSETQSEYKISVWRL